MKALWIRVDANIGGKDVVWKAVEFLGISAPQAVGHLVMFWGNVANHGDGSVAEKFDAQLEAWAQWSGERGLFAEFIRTECLDARGKIKRWDEMQGALEARRKHDRERKRRKNPLGNSTGNSAGSSTETPRNFRGNSGARNVTERNVTDTTSNPPVATDVAPARGGKKPLTPSPGTAEVLAHYVLTHPKRRPGPKEARVVAKALESGYSVEDLKRAITGNATDDWHREKKKHELAYVLRDNGKIDDFIARADAADAQEPLIDEWGQLTARGCRVAGLVS
jgi:hypothetical protein